MNNPILIGQAEVIDLVQPQVRAMLENEGVYIAGDSTRPELLVVLISRAGKIHCVKLDTELSPGGFLPTLTVHGPYLTEAPAAPSAESATSPAGPPIYQVGSRTAAGICWWDVDKASFDRKIAAGYLESRVIYAAPQPEHALAAQLNAAYAALDAVADWAKREDGNSETGSGTRLLALLLKHGVHPREENAVRPASGDKDV